MNAFFIQMFRYNNIFSLLNFKMVLTCRFYAARYPEPDDVVMVNVRQIADMGAYVHLLEYDNIEGEIEGTLIIQVYLTL